jgi:hypothetical protein
MAHTRQWMLEKRVAWITYDGDISLEQMQEINTWLDEFLSEGQTPVHLILDTSKMGAVPNNISVLRNSLSALQKSGWGLVILIGMNRMIRFFAEVIGKQFGLQLKAADSVEEAKSLILEYDKTIGELSS